MTSASPWHLISYAWATFAVYWAFSALSVKRTAEHENLWKRALHTFITFLSFVLLFRQDLQLGPLSHLFMPRVPPVRAAGVALTWIGVAFAIWARWHIGKNWSGLVTLKKDHQLIRSGPYRWVRHPIYSGLLLAVGGTALVLGEWRGLLALVALVITHFFKARREEALMARHFGSVYEEYRGKTGFLVPGIG